MSRKRDPRSELTPQELEGFVQLISGNDGLPEPTEYILAYLERLAALRQTDDKRASEFADVVIRRILIDRLRSAHVQRIRSFDFHLKAKRVAAKCNTTQVALVLDLDVQQYEQLEAGERNPLQESAELLARITNVLGLRLKEFRDALIGYVQRGRPQAQVSFARGAKGRVSKEEYAIAEEDLRIAGAASPQLGREVLDRIDRKVAEVAALLRGSSAI